MDVPPPVEHAILRVAQEAVANALRHAAPGRIRLELSTQDGQVVVGVADDGAGFDPAEAVRRHGMGLVAMRVQLADRTQAAIFGLQQRLVPLDDALSD